MLYTHISPQEQHSSKLPAIMTSHPDFGESTTATEVSRAFSNEIKNKTGTSTP